VEITRCGASYFLCRCFLKAISMGTGVEGGKDLRYGRKATIPDGQEGI
jgi:hypothetical protein